MDQVDNYIPTPLRDTDKDFLMAIEDVFSITGRGTVATGRVERGKIRVGENVELVGLKNTRVTTVTGLEMFQKSLDEAIAGDNVGVLLRGIQKNDIERGMVLSKPGYGLKSIFFNKDLIKKRGINKIRVNKRTKYSNQD